MSDFAQKLKERGLSDLAIQRVLSVKENLRLQDDDPVFELFFELEWYVKQMESIPQQIEQTQLACKAIVEAETKQLVQRSVSEFAREINHQISQTMAIRGKTDFLRALSRATAQMLVIVGIALTVGFSLSGRWPSYFDAHFTESAVLNFIYSALQAPTYMTMGVFLLSLPVVGLVEKILLKLKRY